MFWYELILALVLALIVMAILRPSARYRTSTGASALLFFLPLLFLLIWASGAWLTPIGTPVMDVYWLSFLLPALFLLILLLALSTPSAPPRETGSVTPANAEEEAVAGTALAFGIFFWVLILSAIVALLVHYF